MFKFVIKTRASELVLVIDQESEKSSDFQFSKVVFSDSQNEEPKLALCTGSHSICVSKVNELQKI